MEKVTQRKIITNQEIVYTPPKDPGQIFLEELGYQQQNKRILSLSDQIMFNIAYVQTSFFIFYYIPLCFQLVSPLTLIITYLIASVFTMILSATIAEIITAYPTSGSFYTLTFLLAPKSYCQHLGLICGYLQYFANIQQSSSSANDVFQQFIDLFIYFDYLQGLDTSTIRNIKIGGSIGLVLIFNLIILKLQGIRLKIYVLISFILLVLSFLITLIFFWNFGTYSDTKIILGQTGPQDNFWNIVLVFKIWTFVFLGHSVSVNISEEVYQPQNNQAKCIIISQLILTVMGFFTLIAFIYCSNIQSLEDYVNIQNYQDIISLTDYLLKFKTISGTIYQDKFTLLIIQCFNILNYLSMIIIINIVVTKTQFALIRDKAFIGSYKLAKDENKSFNLITISNVFLCIVIQIIESYNMQIQSFLTSAYSVMTTLTMFFPIILKLSTNKNDFKKHKFDLGPFSNIFGWMSVAILIFQMIILCLPYHLANVNPDPNQYSNSSFIILYIIAVIIFILFLYYCPKYGIQKYIRGPIRWDDKFGQNKQKKTNFQKVQELYALVENGKGYLS